ncbi:hypothetical protein XELAEV_18020641mg [Xenopus laevis]|uniref:Uncharacterized protein n=1 Tax=Xenopus laevis TaxID=8355 RepID=A0A974D9Q6_XENLA|nr:hypothetical protein XELAEV_18020641mg [Xenopus laevis]
MRLGLDHEKPSGLFAIDFVSPRGVLSTSDPEGVNCNISGKKEKCNIYIYISKMKVGVACQESGEGRRVPLADEGRARKIFGILWYHQCD